MPLHTDPTRVAEGGYSLIEILLVLVLLGIATAMAVPRIDVDAYRISSAMEGLGSQLLAAQRRALTEQHDVVVAFDTAARTLRLHDDADDDGAIDVGEQVSFVPLGEGAVFGAGMAPLPSWWQGTGAVSFTHTQGGLPAVTFHRGGSASEEGGVLLTGRLAAAGRGAPRHSHALRIERSTGRVSWYDYDGSRWRTSF
jgi:prepilin-type N-terminal cleavage/methylation domain-containing protein